MYRKKIMTVLITALMFSLVACGKDTEEVIAVDAEITEESSEEISEEISTEAETIITYVEENGLTFTDETKVQTQGILSMPDNTDTDIIDVEWELSNISNDTEDDVKIITIEQNVYGYIWSDGDIFKTNLNLPSALLCDINTGKIIAMTTESTTTEIEWEEKYSIETIEEVSWEDGSSSDWVEDPNGGERLSSTLKVTDTIKISKDYDGLAFVLIPITSSDNSISGSYIMDVWSDESYLFSISDLSAKFEQIKDGEIAESEEGEEEIKQEETKSAETSNPTETTAPKENDTKTAHTHNYTSTISIQPTCTTNGVKTYTCSCGDSYTENLGYGAHDFSIPVYQTVHHDAQYDVIKRELPSQKVIICRCGAEFTTNEGYDNHVISQIEAEGPFTACGSSYDIEERPGGFTYDYVEVSPAYDSEEIVAYKCSICGTTQ